VLDDAEDVRGFSRWRDAHSDAALTAEATPDDPVLQLYTSGTTGLPKGAVLAHRSFFAVRDALHAADLGWIDFRPDDVSFSMVPYFHVGGVWWSVQGLNAGITNVCMRSFSPGKALELVQRHRVTQVALVPAMLQMLLHERGASPEALASLRKVIYGGAPISEGLLAQASARLRAEFVQLYGLTESGNTALCLPPDGHRPGSSLRISAGRPYPGFAVRIVDSAGRELPHGQVGEVCLRTQGVMIGYWNNPEATAKTLRDGWLFTGDAGYLDEGGHLFLCDRIKDCIIAAGENIYPAEVDNALRTIPGVRDAATIGIPDERWGEAVMAYVVEESAGSLNARACMLALKGKIADYKIPRAYAFVDQIPRNASGKILRRVLREQHWAGYERRVN
jgi:long-chain acyl-CoA synthetase